MKQIHVINITGIHIPEDEWADTSIKLHIGNTKEEIERSVELFDLKKDDQVDMFTHGVGHLQKSVKSSPASAQVERKSGFLQQKGYYG